MKQIFRLLALALAVAVGARAQTSPTLSTLPSPTAHQVAISITNNCASTVTCTFNLYRCTGALTACSATAAVWQLINDSPLSAGQVFDTAVTAGTTYSYEAYALATESGSNETSPGSNEVAATVPLGPSAPTLAAPSAQ